MCLFMLTNSIFYRIFQKEIATGKHQMATTVPKQIVLDLIIWVSLEKRRKIALEE